MIAAGEKLLGALAGWRGYAAAAFAGAAVAWIAQGWRYGAEIAELQRQQAEENDAQAQATVAAVEAARTEERRRTAAVEKARDDATKQAAAAAAGLLALALSLTGCAPALTRWLAPRSPEIPPLPTEARQGPQPSICSPTCSAGLATELKNLRALQTAPALQDWRANGRLMPSGKRRIQGGRRAITRQTRAVFGTSSPIRACVLR